MGQEQAQVLTNTLSSPTTSQSLLTNSLLSITNTEAAEGRGESKKKAFGLKKPNALTKLYLSADREESAKIASVKAVWILAYPLGRPCVGGCTHAHGLQVLKTEYLFGLRENDVHGSLLVFVFNHHIYYTSFSCLCQCLLAHNYSRFFHSVFVHYIHEKTKGRGRHGDTPCPSIHSWSNSSSSSQG